MRRIVRALALVAVSLSFLGGLWLIAVANPTPPNSGPPPTYPYRFGPPTPTPTVTPAIWREKP